MRLRVVVAACIVVVGVQVVYRSSTLSSLAAVGFAPPGAAEPLLPVEFVGRGREDGCGERVRVAVCFYGLNRALRHTVASIRRHVMEPLARACADVDVFYHTWTVTDLEDTGRAGGERAAVTIGGPAEMAALLGTAVTRAAATDQAAFDADRSNSTYYRGVDRRYGGPNFRNLLRQLESLRLVTRLWRGEGASDLTHYAAVLYARPDLRFLDDVNATQLLGLRENDFLTPYWHQWSGLNDRLAAGRPRAAAAFGERIALAKAYVGRTFLRSESFLKWVMCDHHNFDLAFLEARALRVRANGDVADNDVCLEFCTISLKKACRADCRVLAPDKAPPLADWAKKQQARDRAKPKQRTKKMDTGPARRPHHNSIP